MQSVVIPGDQTSSVRINVGDPFSELTADNTDLDAIGIILTGGQSYRITLDPFDGSSISSKDPFITDIINLAGASFNVSDDDSGSGTASVLIFTPAVTDTYFVVVGPGDTGWWTLQVEEFTAPADDFSNALDPSGAISIWETQDGVVETNGDTDTIAISLTAGVAVDITLYGNDGGFFGELADTEIVSFVDSGGVAVNPALYETADALGKFTTGSDLDAHQISFTPTSTGVYYLTVGGDGGEIGDYSVSVSGRDSGIYSIRENEEFVATGNDEVDMFFLGAIDSHVDHIYTDRDGDGVTTLTYSVPGVNPGFSEAAHNVVNSAWTNGYEPASGVVLSTFFDIMDAISEFANIDFVEVPDTGVRAGTFRIGDTDLSLGSASGALVTGWSGFPEWMMAGETWINTDKGAENLALIQSFGVPNAELDNFLINRTMHEFTHNLGLNHPDQSTVSASIDPSLLGQEYSVMSRTGSGMFNFPVAGDLFPQTLMWFDIQAIQAAYGVNTTETAGADIFEYKTNGRHYSTIWDYAGVDTISIVGGSDVNIDLTPGTWQDVGTVIDYTDGTQIVGFKTKTVFIAPDTTIENILSGNGHDLLRGNSVANAITGRNGDDTLRGYDGDDTLRGNGDADDIQGGDGDDDIFAGTGADIARGNLDNDLVIGGDGDDTLYGNQGDDDLRGGNHEDVMYGGDGADTLNGGAHGDLVFGAAGADILVGSDGFDTLKGGNEGDTITGGANSDTLFGGEGADSLNGGGGPDVIFGQAGDDTVLGSTGNDTLKGNGGADSLKGGDSHDDLFGGDGDDTLNGGKGNDTLNGGLNDDFLSGDAGFDTLKGGSGNDVFFFADGAVEADVITDFTAGAASDDVIELSGFGALFDEFTDIAAAASQIGDDVVIDLGDGETVTLTDTLLVNLHQDDFIFS